MASSGDISDEVSPRSIPSVTRQYNRRGNKQFDINQSRLSVGHPDLQESMLAYSKHMRKISEGRKKVSLEVRAHHVPKHTIALIPRQRPKIVSLNDLLIKKKKPFHDRKKSPKSAKSLPNLSIRQLSQKQLNISFVSASDLHEIMDYNIKPDKRWETSQFTLWSGGDVLSSINDSDTSYSRSDPGVVPDLKPIQETDKLSHRQVRKLNQGSHSHKGADKPLHCKFHIPGEQLDTSVRDNQRGRVISHRDGLDVQRDRFMFDSGGDTKACADGSNVKSGSSIPHNSTHRSGQVSEDAVLSSYKQELDSRTVSRSAIPMPVDTNSLAEVTTRYAVPPLQLPKPPNRTHGTTAKYLVKMGSLRQRPRRAKRMKLHRPELGVIPEGESGGDIDVGGDSVWPVSGRLVFYPSKNSYDAIRQFRENEHANPPELLGLINSETKVKVPGQRAAEELPRIKLTRSSDNKLETYTHVPEERDNVPIDEYEDLPEDDVTDVSVSSGAVPSDKPNKLRAHKKMTKLVFLRDSPDKRYHRP